MYNENSFFEFADPTSKVIQFKNNIGNIVFGLNVCHLPKIATEGNLIWVFNHGKVTSLDFINETAAKLAHNMLMEAVDSLQLNCEVGGLVEITYSELDALKTAETLVPGTFYKITDRGDQGIVIQALSTTELSQQGVRFMNCPITYQTTGLFLGVWHTGLTPVAGEKVIWGGKVFVNRFGNVGTVETDVKLHGDDWTEVSKPAYGETNANYTTLQFSVIYDFENDWIAKQWDKYNNVLGCDYATEQEFAGFGYNPTDISDWNMATNPANIFTDNNCYGVYNNATGDTIERNICFSIYENTCSGSIVNNNISHLNSISKNTCSSIYKNKNNGTISLNTNTNEISHNINNGFIQLNSNTGAITYNRNNGNISTNSNTGSINRNSNNGHIQGCEAPCTNINDNNNNGYILNYATVGALTDTIVNK